MAPIDSAALLAADPKANADYQWVRRDPTLDRDKELQYFVNIHTGNRVWGRTDGTASDHIHLRFRDGTNSGLNLDPVTGEVSRDGNILGDLVALAFLTVEAGAGGAFGASGAAVDTAKNLFNPSDPPVPAGLVFPPEGVSS